MIKTYLFVFFDRRENRNKKYKLSNKIFFLIGGLKDDDNAMKPDLE